MIDPLLIEAIRRLSFQLAAGGDDELAPLGGLVAALAQGLQAEARHQINLTEYLTTVLEAQLAERRVINERLASIEALLRELCDAQRSSAGGDPGPGDAARRPGR